MLGIHVIDEPLEDRSAQLLIGCPFAELHLRDQLRLHPRGRSYLGRHFFERAFFGHEELQFPLRFGKRSIVKAASGAPHINKITILVQSQQQRSEVFSGSFRRRKTSYHEMVGLLCFDLQPISRAGLLILAFLQLRNDAFKPVLLDGFVECNAGFFDMIRKADPAAVIRNQFSQHRLALDQRKFHEVIAIEIEQIEGVKIDRNLFVGPSDLPRA